MSHVCKAAIAPHPERHNLYCPLPVVKATSHSSSLPTPLPKRTPAPKCVRTSSTVGEVFVPLAASVVALPGATPAGALATPAAMPMGGPEEPQVSNTRRRSSGDVSPVRPRTVQARPPMQVLRARSGLRSTCLGRLRPAPCIPPHRPAPGSGRWHQPHPQAQGRDIKRRARRGLHTRINGCDDGLDGLDNGASSASSGKMPHEASRLKPLPRGLWLLTAEPRRDSQR